MSMEEVDQAMQEMQEHAKKYTEYVTYLYNRSNKAKLAELAEVRQFSPKTLEAQQVFYVPKSGASLMVPKYIEDLKSFGVLSAQNKPVFYNRWLFPIKNIYGQVVGLVGYSPKAKERYLFGRSLYYDRHNTLFGLENISLAQGLGYALITEGITDAIRLRDIGYANAFAQCGTRSSSVIDEQINRRVAYGVICFPDRDDSGQKAVKGWNFKNRIVLWTDPVSKDVDEMCKQPEGIATVKKIVTPLIENLRGGYIATNELTMRIEYP